MFVLYPSCFGQRFAVLNVSNTRIYDRCVTVPRLYLLFNTFCKLFCAFSFVSKYVCSKCSIASSQCATS